MTLVALRGKYAVRSSPKCRKPSTPGLPVQSKGRYDRRHIAEQAPAAAGWHIQSKSQPAICDQLASPLTRITNAGSIRLEFSAHTFGLLRLPNAILAQLQYLVDYMVAALCVQL